MKVNITTIVKVIEQVAADSFFVSATQVRERGRSKTACLARMASYHTARTMTRFSYPELGTAFGRDHTTVLHGVRKMDANKDPEIRRTLERIHREAKRRLVAMGAT